METEIKRKIAHVMGMVTIIFILIFGKYVTSAILAVVTTAGFLAAEYRKNKKKYKFLKIKPIDRLDDMLEEEFKTVERPNTLPFKGAIEFGVGCFIATIAFSEIVAIACIAVLALADAMSTLVGYYFGKYKLPINKKKTWEGSTTFFLISFFVLSFFTDPLRVFVLAVLATVAEMLPFVDDNLSIPIVLGVAMSLLL